MHEIWSDAIPRTRLRGFQVVVQLGRIFQAKPTNYNNQWQDISLYKILTGHMIHQRSVWQMLLARYKWLKFEIALLHSRETQYLDYIVIPWQSLQILLLKEGNLGSISNLLSAPGQRMMDNQVISRTPRRLLWWWTKSFIRPNLKSEATSLSVIISGCKIKGGGGGQRTKINMRSRLFFNK